MAKQKTVFVCNACGAESSRWLGRCPQCGGWNTVEEVSASLMKDVESASSHTSAPPILLQDVDMRQAPRMTTGYSELDRVLGGGVVAGSLVLLGGDPGIGKSTLLLQAAANLCKQGDVLYVSGEESAMQVKLRAQRLGVDAQNLYMFAETDCAQVEERVRGMKPSFVVIDSIQTLYCKDLSGMPGNIGQLREACGRMMRLAKETGSAIFLVGHVTKEGAIAGPRVLEHIVDAVLYFEGDRGGMYRVLRAVKNRFGSTNEVGLFEMKDNGMQQVENPSAMLVSPHAQQEAGSVVFCSIEGTRAMLVEIQALVSPTAFGMPRRMSTGFDYNRLNLLLAVMEKRSKVPLSNQDAYLNVVGGMKLDEPAADLGVVSALASSHFGQNVGEGTAVFGEVGLTGEVRPVSHAEIRLAECAKLGIKRCIMPLDNLKNLRVPQGLQVEGVRTVSQAIAALLKNQEGSS